MSARPLPVAKLGYQTLSDSIPSSKKIKQILSSIDDPTTKVELIDLFKSISLSKYRYIDPNREDSWDHFGIIAEDMPDGIYTNSDQSSYCPNINSEAVITNIALNVETQVQTLTFSLNTPANMKVDQISPLSDALVYLSYEGSFSLIQIFNNLTVIDSSTVSLTTSQENVVSIGDPILLYGSYEVIPTVSKNNYFELTSCVVRDLLARVEALESV